MKVEMFSNPVSMSGKAVKITRKKIGSKKVQKKPEQNLLTSKRGSDLLRFIRSANNEIPPEPLIPYNKASNHSNSKDLIPDLYEDIDKNKSFWEKVIDFTDEHDIISFVIICGLVDLAIEGFKKLKEKNS